MKAFLRSARRSFQVLGAFFKLGFQQEMSYPLNFFSSQFGTLLPVFIFFFVSKLVDRPNYFAFVLLGLVAARFLDTGTRAFSLEIDTAINRGWLEMFLVEPVRWRLLPVSMVPWRVVQGLVGAALMAAIGFALGARIRTDQLGFAIAILGFALIAGLAIGTISASLKVLAKQGDPVLLIYGVFVQIFSGVFFPVDTLPSGIRWISWLLPHTYAISALREATLPVGSEALTSLGLGPSFLALFGFSILMFPFSLWLYGKALEYGRKLGVLGGY